jgi:hypothetical protein
MANTHLAVLVATLPLVHQQAALGSRLEIDLVAESRVRYSMVSPTNTGFSQ